MKETLSKHKKLSKAEFVYLKQQQQRHDEHGGIFNVVRNAAVRYHSNPEQVNKEQGIS